MLRLLRERAMAIGLTQHLGLDDQSSLVQHPGHLIGPTSVEVERYWMAGGFGSMRNLVASLEGSQHIDSSRIYITGLSAGGGMTSDMLADYPDVFAGGAIDSGLPADCATSLTSALNCEYDNQNQTPAQWGALAKGADPGWTGPWPRVAIWQGTSDTTVNPVNATEEMDQWTDVWGISQTPSSTQSLTGGTTENVYNDSSGNPAVELYTISGMGHGLAVNPGSTRSSSPRSRRQVPATTSSPAAAADRHWSVLRRPTACRSRAVGATL